MEKEVSRNRVLEILNGYSELEKLSGLELVSKLVENVSLLEKEKEKIDKVAKKLEYSEEYKADYNLIIKEEAEIDENGNYKMIDTDKIVLKENNSFVKRMEEFQEKYKDEIAKVTEAREYFNKYMKENVKFEFLQIDKNLLPKDINMRQYKLLVDMI